MKIVRDCLQIYQGKLRIERFTHVSGALSPWLKRAWASLQLEINPR